MVKMGDGLTDVGYYVYSLLYGYKPHTSLIRTTKSSSYLELELFGIRLDTLLLYISILNQYVHKGRDHYFAQYPLAAFRYSWQKLVGIALLSRQKRPRAMLIDLQKLNN